jgi:hypothetical protein
MEAIDKHEKNIYSFEFYFFKWHKKVVWPILVLYSFLEVFPNGTTQGYFCLNI